MCVRCHHERRLGPSNLNIGLHQRVCLSQSIFVEVDLVHFVLQLDTQTSVNLGLQSLFLFLVLFQHLEKVLL